MADDLVKIIVIVLGIILVLPMAMMLLIWPMGGMWGGGHMWNNGDAGWLGLASWAVIMLILLGAIGLFLRGFLQAERGDTDPALEELRMAYARGELSDEEFEERRNRLEESS